MRALILEDNADRRLAMASVLADLIPNLAVEFFVTSGEIIERIENTGVFDVAFIALDNDLDMIQAADGKVTDAGDGIQVAKLLATRPPIVPVIVHTTNTRAGDQIVELLKGNDWEVSRVEPYGDLRWISEAWRPLIRDSLVQRSPLISVSSLGVRIIKNYLRTHDDERLFGDLLRAISYVACHKAIPDDLCLELVLFEEQKVFESHVSAGFSLLTDLTAGATLEAFAWENCKSKSATITVTDESLEPSLRSLLRQKKVRQLRLEFVDSSPKHHALFLIASRCPAVDLHGLQIEEVIIEGRSVLELALLIMTSMLPDQHDLHDKNNAESTWPAAWRESKG